MQKLLEQFVRVRLVKGNAMDLDLFQFDYDLTFAAFFLNSDGTIYGRFGSRSDEHAEKDITIDGFKKALAGALELHKGYPDSKASLAAKRGGPVKYKVPEQYPSLAGKYKTSLDYTGKVVQSCLHCHQVREADRKLFRDNRQPIPQPLLFPWPMPNVIGLVLDPTEKARVKTVEKGSLAEKAGFKPGDNIEFFAGQPIISIADVQWVLHNAGESGEIKAQVRRSGGTTSTSSVTSTQTKALTLSLPQNWRRATDISWRPTSWELRRMVTGGLVLEDLGDAERRKASLSENALALRVKYVGQYNDHAAGKRAGFQKDDILLSLGDKNDRMTESQAMAYLVNARRPGDKISATVMRNGEKLQLALPIQ